MLLKSGASCLLVQKGDTYGFFDVSTPLTAAAQLAVLRPQCVLVACTTGIGLCCLGSTQPLDSDEAAKGDQDIYRGSVWYVMRAMGFGSQISDTADTQIYLKSPLITRSSPLRRCAPYYRYLRRAYIALQYPLWFSPKRRSFNTSSHSTHYRTSTSPSHTRRSASRSPRWSRFPARQPCWTPCK